MSFIFDDRDTVSDSDNAAMIHGTISHEPELLRVTEDFNRVFYRNVQLGD